jgi:hypothetical protein
MPDLTDQQKAILKALADHGPLGLTGLAKKLGHAHAGPAYRSLTALQDNDYVSGALETPWSITNDGREALARDAETRQ